MLHQHLEATDNQEKLVQRLEEAQELELEQLGMLQKVLASYLAPKKRQVALCDLLRLHCLKKHAATCEASK